MQMYYTPINEFVARLFGEPEITIFPTTLTTDGGVVKLRTLDQETPLLPEADAAEVLKKENIGDVDVGIRGNDVAFSFTDKGEGWITGSVYANEPIGNKVIMTVDVNGVKIRISAANNTVAELDQRVYIKFNMKNALYFNKETETFITRSGIQKYA
jgi:multiple sugar transport system ATP-binding protein